MKRSIFPEDRTQQAVFLMIVAAVTGLFFWLMLPYSGAILWGVVAAIVCAPVNHWLVRRLNGRRSLAAALVLLLLVLLVVVPALLISASLIDEAGDLYRRIESGALDPAAVLIELQHALPDWAKEALGPQFADIASLRESLNINVAGAARAVAGQALSIGQGALSALASLGIMLYLTFFLLRDGDHYRERIGEAVPLDHALRDRLLEDFVTVVRATIKGSGVVAVIQGVLGGLIFSFLGIPGALLWGLLMGLFSLVPAVGAGIVWVPVAIYLLATGSVFEGAVLVACGIFVIGMVDNLLRPILVGKDTKLPDVVVLIATVAGLEIFGMAGIIVGPVIAALFISVWRNFTELRHGRIVLEDEG